MDEFMVMGGWKNNGEMIRDLALSPLDYLGEEDRVLDCTYGEGIFWKYWQPHELVACDLIPEKSPIGYSVDFTNLPFESNSFDVVVLDGPYKLNGTPDEGNDARYGVDVPSTWQGRMELIKKGMAECARVSRRHVFVKGMDQVSSGHVRWQTRVFADHGEALGMRHEDQLLLGSPRAQPLGRIQRHAHGHPSTLMIFRKKR